MIISEKNKHVVVPSTDVYERMYECDAWAMSVWGTLVSECDLGKADTVLYKKILKKLWYKKPKPIKVTKNNTKNLNAQKEGITNTNTKYPCYFGGDDYNYINKWTPSRWLDPNSNMQLRQSWKMYRLFMKE